MAHKKDTNTNTWYFYGKYTNAHGKVVQYKRRGFTTAAKAKKAEQEFKEQLKNPVDHITLDELIELFHVYIQKRVKENSVRTYTNVYSKIKKTFDGEMKIKSFNRYILQDYFDELDAVHSKEYVQKIFYKLNVIFKFALENDYLERNPLVGVKLDARKNEVPKEMEFWEPSDFNKFINTVDNIHYKAIFSLLYYMGVRRGECLALTWEDIDFRKKTIRINKTIPHGKTEPTTPKTKNSYRTITMPNSLINTLQEYLAHISEFKTVSAKNYVFGHDRPLPDETLRRTFKKYIEMTNEKYRFDEQIPDIRIHDLRHSHASFLINNMNNKFTDFDIAKRLGDTVSTLHNTYAHWFKAGDSEIIDFMNS